jgi:hypothetical protein
MAVNLLRDARVFFTLNVDPTTGVIQGDNCANSDTFEIQVLDNLSFTQNTTQEVITLNEAGETPNRGQVAFNTALEPAEFSMSTYIKPRTGNNVEEQYLWNALLSNNAIGSTGGWNAGVATTANSQVHQLQKFGLIIIVKNQGFLIDNCALDQASIDFGLDALATINWTGRGAKVRMVEGLSVAAASTTEGNDVAFSGANGTLQGVARGPFNKTSKYLANKLSSIELNADIGGATAYSVPITGGNLTIANNITYLTPANLGVVNTPVTYFTGTRAISGNLTAYLRNDTATGKRTVELLNDLLTNSATAVQPEFNMKLHIGGSSSANMKVTVDLPAVMLQLPTVNFEQIVSTTINFTAMGSSSAAFDVEEDNEMTVTYSHPV